MVTKNININASDEFIENLEKIQGTHNVTSDDLMTDEFIGRNTDFKNWQELQDASPLKSDDDFDSPEFSAFISERTKFDDFESFNEAAVKEYLRKRIET